MIVSEYVLLLMPERFWLWYSVMIPVLLLMRYPDYRQRKWLFFYLDFCYYVQVRLAARGREAPYTVVTWPAPPPPPSKDLLYFVHRLGR